MTVLNLNNANKLYYGATEVQKLYKGSELLYPNPTFNLLDLEPALWLDADDSSTLTLVSGAVSEWRDKSGNNRHATQATAENRPLFVANGLNGTTVIRFDGIDHFLSLTTPLLTDNFSIFSIIKNNIFDGNAYLSQNDSTSSSQRFFVFSGRSSEIGPQRIMGFQVGTSSVISKPPLTNFNLFYATRSGTNVKQSYNGNAEITGTVNSGNAQSINLSIGVDSTNLSVATYFTGDISQIIIFDRVLTQAEREQVEGYLAWQTGLQGNLPSNHPYKNIAP